MLTPKFADHFTRDWISSWNARDLERILAHYAEDLEFSSPLIPRFTGAPSATLRGKPAVRAYWFAALARLPQFKFVRLGFHTGVGSIVLRYRSVFDTIACETFHFNDQGKVNRADAHYNQLDLDAAKAQQTPLFVSHLTPVLNVSSVTESFAWFEKLGFRTSWGWSASGNQGDPPTFGAVGAGEVQIFMCQNGQGGRGRGPNRSTSGGPDGDDTMDKGVWMSLWVPDVDAAHARCLEQGLDVTHPPTDEPWGVREMHVRHPDGHVFRISGAH